MIGPDLLDPQRTTEIRAALATFGLRLRLARAVTPMSDADLCNRTGLSLERLRDLQFNRSHPFQREARELAQALGVSVDFFRVSSVSTEALCNVLSGLTEARTRSLAEAPR